jgi:solute:Na+ symporter, SSS family
VVAPLDIGVIVAYMLATIGLGIWLGRGQRDRVDYFLGRHQLPTWALLLSIVATETSTVTFLSVPAKTFIGGGNFFFLQVALGYIVGRLVVVAILMPQYFRGQQMTAYAVLQDRFGPATRKTASFIFLLARTVGDGLRLYLAALAIQISMSLSFGTSVLIVAGATALYAFSGGVRSVVWNDCLQFFVYMGGALLILGVILHRLPGGLEQVWQFGVETDRLRTLDFRWFATDHETFWPALMGGAFLSLATHGADQLIVQRYLCARDRRSASFALGWSGPVVLLQFALFLFIGLAIACYFHEFDPSRLALKGDQAILNFVASDLFSGARGLILAAVCAAAMSTLSSSVNSSASSLLDDLFAGWTSRQSDSTALWAARFATILFTVAQATVAFMAEYVIRDQVVVDRALAIAGFAAGLLLGLYFLGLLVGKAPSWLAILSLAVGIAVNLNIFLLGWHWLWYPFAGSTSTLAFGLVLFFIRRVIVGSPPQGITS